MNQMNCVIVYFSFFFQASQLSGILEFEWMITRYPAGHGFSYDADAELLNRTPYHESAHRGFILKNQKDRSPNCVPLTQNQAVVYRIFVAVFLSRGIAQNRK